MIHGRSPEDYQTAGFLSQALIALNRREDAIVSYKRQVTLIDVHLDLNRDDPRACIPGAGANAIIGDKDRSAEFIKRALQVGSRRSDAALHAL